MKRMKHYILLCMLLLLTFIGCDVHEFPDNNDELVPVTLHLDFSIPKSIYKEMLYTRSNAPEDNDKPHSIRHIINAYRTDGTRSDSRQVDAQFVITREIDDSLDFSTEIQLPEGNYDLCVWSDYVNPNSSEDKYYNTSDFSEIILMDRNNHSGSNNYRDAFRGYANVEVKNLIYYTNVVSSRSVCNEAEIDMRRPMGEFRFIATDVEAFVTRAIQRMSEKQQLPQKLEELPTDKKAALDYLLEMINVNDYKIIFRYNTFMPCSFNMFTDKPADSWMGVSFESSMMLDENYEMVVGYDYLFVNGKETTMSISFEIYDPDGEKIASISPFDVPVVRDKITVVRGAFLTTLASGGVYINPGYDGDDYNIEIF